MDRNQQSMLIEAQFKELAEYHNGIAMSSDNGRVLICGQFEIDLELGENSYQDTYKLEIILPENYPQTPPTVRELENRIPKEFHLNPDKTLCLAPPLAVRKKFTENKTLLGFFIHLVAPYLFSFNYWKQYGAMPYGEYSHGGKGIWEYYQKCFDVTTDFSVLSLLKSLVENTFRGHLQCPCGSGKITRKCHGALLLDIMKYQNQEDFLYDFLNVIQHFKESGQELPDGIITEQFLRNVEKVKKDFKRKYE